MAVEAMLKWDCWHRSDGCRAWMDQTSFAGVSFTEIFYRAMRLVFADESGNPGLLYAGALKQPARDAIADNGLRTGFTEMDDLKYLKYGRLKFSPGHQLEFQGPDKGDIANQYWASAQINGIVVNVDFYALINTANTGFGLRPKGFPKNATGVDMLVWFTGGTVLHELMHSHGFNHPLAVNWALGSQYASTLPHIAHLAVLRASPYWSSIFAPAYAAGPPNIGFRCCGAGTVDGLSTLAETSAGVAISSWARNRLDVFVRGDDYDVSHRAYDNGWYDWDSAGGIATSAPAAVSWGPNRIDVVVRDTFGGISHRAWNGKWNPWDSLGGSAISAPTICSWGADRLDVFVRWTDGGFRHRAWVGDHWEPWDNIGGTFDSSPAATCLSSGRIDVVGRTTGSEVLHRSYGNGAWSAWKSLGGQATSSPAICATSPKQLYVFARGFNDSLKYCSHTAVQPGGKGPVINTPWSKWQTLDGSITSAPAVVSWGDGRIDLIARGLKMDVLHRAMNPGGAWTGWDSLGGVVT